MASFQSNNCLFFSDLFEKLTENGEFYSDFYISDENCTFSTHFTTVCVEIHSILLLSLYFFLHPPPLLTHKARLFLKTPLTHKSFNIFKWFARFSSLVSPTVFQVAGLNCMNNLFVNYL